MRFQRGGLSGEAAMLDGKSLYSYSLLHYIPKIKSNIILYIFYPRFISGWRDARMAAAMSATLIVPYKRSFSATESPAPIVNW
jgi:hypothetical protein